MLPSELLSHINDFIWDRLPPTYIASNVYSRDNKRRHVKISRWGIKWGFAYEHINVVAPLSGINYVEEDMSFRVITRHKKYDVIKLFLADPKFFDKLNDAITQNAWVDQVTRLFPNAEIKR